MNSSGRRSRKSGRHSRRVSCDSAHEKKRRRQRRKRKASEGKSKLVTMEGLPTTVKRQKPRGLLALPQELLVSICALLSPRELRILGHTCALLRMVSHDEGLKAIVGRRVGCHGFVYRPFLCTADVSGPSFALATGMEGSDFVMPKRRKRDPTVVRRSSKSLTRHRLNRSMTNLKSLKGWKTVASLLTPSGCPARSPSEEEEEGNGAEVTVRGEMEMEEVTVLFTGPPACGVSSLISDVLWSRFSHSSEATIYDRHDHQVVVDGTPVLVDIIDTQGHSKYSELRHTSIDEADAFVACYSLTSNESYLNCGNEHLSDLLRMRSKDVPLVLVGCKEDVTDGREVAQERGVQLADTLNCPYFETSAKYSINTDRLLRTVVRMALKQRRLLLHDSDVWQTQALNEEAFYTPKRMMSI